MFYIIKNDVAEEIKIRRSLFIAALHRADNIEAAKDFISEISKIHKNATHNCWGYIVGEKGETAHFSDAGEPAGTAGKPIYNTLRKHELTNIAAVVTRYYGGVKLGIRGLIDAYSQAVENAIESATIQALIKSYQYQLSVGYDQFEQLKYNLTKMNATILDAQFTDNVSLKISAEEHAHDEVFTYLCELQKKGAIKFRASDS